MAAQMDTNKVPLLLVDCNKSKSEIESEIKDLKPEELTSKVNTNVTSIVLNKLKMFNVLFAMQTCRMLVCRQSKKSVYCRQIGRN